MSVLPNRVNYSCSQCGEAFPSEFEALTHHMRCDGTNPKRFPYPITASYVFERIKHGDQEHQDWLRAELNKIFSEYPGM